MDVLTNAGALVVVLGVMVFFHEFGHFAVAKAFGIRVFVFSFGFGKRLLGFRWGDTDCRLSAIPLGGYVKLEGEPEDHVSEDTSRLGDGRDFTSRPRWQRILVYLAGPGANVVLTVVVLTVLCMLGIQMTGGLQDRPIVGAVDAGSPAEAAGLAPGDEILTIDGKPQPTWEEAGYAVLVRPGQAMALRVRRGTEERDVTLRASTAGAERVGTIGVYPLVRVGQVLADAPAAKAGIRTDDAILRIDGTPIRAFAEIPAALAAAGGRAVRIDVWREGTVVALDVEPRTDGGAPRIGIGEKAFFRKLGFGRAVVEAVRWTWTMTRQTFDILGRLLTARLSPKSMMGPLGIAGAAGDAARGGVRQLFLLIAMISLQVGILNLFPLPPLDGGHLAILFGESVLRRDFSMQVKTWILNTGLVALLALIGLVLYSDLSKTSLLGKYLP